MNWGLHIQQTIDISQREDSRGNIETAQTHYRARHIYFCLMSSPHHTPSPISVGVLLWSRGGRFMNESAVLSRCLLLPMLFIIHRWPRRRAFPSSRDDNTGSAVSIKRHCATRSSLNAAVCPSGRGRPSGVSVIIGFWKERTMPYVHMEYVISMILMFKKLSVYMLNVSQIICFNPILLLFCHRGKHGVFFLSQWYCATEVGSHLAFKCMIIQSMYFYWKPLSNARYTLVFYRHLPIWTDLEAHWLSHPWFYASSGVGRRTMSHRFGLWKNCGFTDVIISVLPLSLTTYKFALITNKHNA